MDAKKTTSKEARKVYLLAKPSRCYNCDQKLEQGSIVKLKPNPNQQDHEVYCLSCAGLEGFLMLPAGNAQATKLASRYCNLHHVIWKWSELWKCYERQGLLIDRQSAGRLEKELGVQILNKL